MRCCRVTPSGMVVAGALLAAGMGLLGWSRVATSAETASSTPTSTPAAATKPAHSGEHEHHPRIHKAIRKLEAAKRDLEHAAHDFGGHRVKAIQAIDLALQELRLALQSDKS